MSTSGISTLVAAANIGRTDRADGRARQGGSPFDHLSIGQHLKMQVLRHLEQQRYEVTFGGRRHVVESHVALEPGSQVTAQVEAKGDKLELRYLGAGPRSNAGGNAVVAETPESAEPASGLDGLAAQYRVPLDARARLAIARATAQARDADSMALGGLFLQKLARNVEARDLEALYRALNPDERTPAAVVPAAIEIEDLAGDDDLGARLADAMDNAAVEASDGHVEAATADAGDQGAQQDSQRATRLLNLQDEGSVAWRYGTLPMLVGGKLIELDLVMFRERDAHAKQGGLRRLVMTLDTTHFGRVHVEARAVGSRLMVTLSASTSDAVEQLSAYGGDVRSAIERLGWAVDEVRYEIGAPQSAAAKSVVQHVLSAGSVDQEF
jgi:hypothetical protein